MPQDPPDTAHRLVRSFGQAHLLEDLANDEPPDPKAELSALFERNETLEVLLLALGRLRDEMRQVIYLKFFAALSDEAISQQLGLSLSNVRTLRSRGLARLRQDEILRNYWMT